MTHNAPMISNLPKIAIIGRPNVGKSTLFNRLVGRRQAIVDDIPGVTRDRQYGQVDWGRISFTVVDTGGFIPGVEEGELAKPIQSQVFLALEESEAVIFVVDGRTGLTPSEEELARFLRKKKVPVLLAVNKVDNPSDEATVAEFYKLGFSPILGISAENGRGISEMLDALIPWIRSSEVSQALQRDLGLTILGQPNVGKSTLLNAFLGKEQAVVHAKSGTTLDPLIFLHERGSRLLELVDTAGIRRKSKAEGKIEKVSFLKSMKAMSRAHLVLVLVEATKEMAAQDAKIMNYAIDKGKAVIIVLNKWDLVSPGTQLKEFREKISGRFARQRDIPVIAISAKTKRGIKKLYALMDQVYANYLRRIGTGEFNRVFQKAIREHPHPTVSGKAVHLSYATQSNVAPPRFVIFCNHPKLVKESYLRYLEGVFRRKYNFSGVPLRWVLRVKK